MRTIRMLLVIAIGTGLWFALAQPLPAQPKNTQAAKPYKPVQPIEHMMEGQKKLFGDIKLALHEKDWDEASTSAWILAEIANSNHYQRDDANYQKFADQLSSQCVELAGLAEKREEAAARERVNTIGQTCNACHDQYQKKKPK